MGAVRTKEPPRLHDWRTPFIHLASFKVLGGQYLPRVHSCTFPVRVYMAMYMAMYMSATQRLLSLCTPQLPLEAILMGCATALWLLAAAQHGI